MQALAQVDNYLRRMSVVREAVDDTAGAAQMIAQQKLQVGGWACRTWTDSVCCDTWGTHVTHAQQCACLNLKTTALHSPLLQAGMLRGVFAATWFIQ